VNLTKHFIKTTASRSHRKTKQGKCMKCECKKEFQQKIEDHVKQKLPEGHETYSANLEGYV